MNLNAYLATVVHSFTTLTQLVAEIQMDMILFNLCVIKR